MNRAEVGGGFSRHRTRSVRLLRPPAGVIRPADFALVETEARPPAEGEVLVEVEHVSLDPYLVLRMAAMDFATDPAPKPVVGRVVGRVIASVDPALVPGERVLGFADWAEVITCRASDLRRLPETPEDGAAFLGPLGHSGVTAWLGMVRIGQVKAGETVLVSGAAGAVGSAAGQIACDRGARVIGIAGGADKTRWLREVARFDVVLDHRDPDLAGQIAEAAPGGIDLLFENVGAATLDPALGAMKRFGRVVLCGLVQHYQDRDPVALANFRLLLARAIRILPFSIYDHDDAEPLADLQAMALRDALRWHITRHRGFEDLPAAFVAMLTGQGHGKHVLSLEKERM